MKKTILLLLAGLIVGVTAGYFIFTTGQHQASETEIAQGAQLYSCGMHPQVISDKPGDCPICGMKLTPIKATGSKTDKPTGKGKILYWRAPMNPTEIYDKPGKSKMGMDLVPVYEGDEAGGAGSITINGAVQQNMNLRVSPVVRRDINRVIRTFGTVNYAEDKEYAVNTRVNGWIEKLYVNTTGQYVNKGDPLLEIYSPELVATQEEYLLALKNKEKLEASDNNKGAETLLASAKSRLDYWDIPADQIKRLQDTREINRTIMLRAPNAGIVTHKNVVEGDKVMQGMDLFHIADLSSIWVTATVYESELPLVHKGQSAEIELDYNQSGGPITGTVDFIYPYVDQKSRAVNVRLVFDNKNQRLKPDMFATVKIYSKVAENALAIPAEAIIHSGERNIVFVAHDQGTFEPREIEPGAQDQDGFVQVLNGLFPNEQVVTSGQFLLDSESQTREAIAKMRASHQSMSGNSDTKNTEMNMDKSQPEQNNMGSQDMENMNRQDQEHHTDAEHGTEQVAESKSMDHDSLYACSMHPYFITSDPNGRCPECGMKLTPVNKLPKADVKDAIFYTCSMHPEFITTDPDGKCPICGMKLKLEK